MTGFGPAFRRLFVASSTSDLADGIGRTALPLLGARYTHNPVLISGLVTFAFLPWLLFALPSGALVDRLDRRRAMAAANVVRATSSAVLAVLVITATAGIATLYVVSFAFGLAETVYDSAVRAILPQVVGGDRLDAANSVITVEETLGQTFAGAPLGSILFAVAAAAPLVVNVSGFAAAAVLIMMVRGTYRPVRTTTRTTIARDIVEGVRWLARHRLLRGLTVVSSVTAGLNSMMTGVLVLYVLEVLRLPSGDYGLVLVAAGVGAIGGSVATPPLARRLGRVSVLTGGAVLSATAFLAMGLTRDGIVAVVLYALAAAGIMAWNVLVMSLRQALIPHSLFGRVQGAYRTLAWGAIPVGAIAGGVLAGWLGIRSVFVIAGSGMLVAATALGLFLRRHADELVTVPGTRRVEPVSGG